MPDTILIRTDERAAGRVVVKPAGFLGQSFAIYRDLVRDSGARFEWDEKHYLLAVERVPILVTALEQAGFEIAFSPDLAQRLKGEAAAIRADLTAGEQLVAQIDTELATRGRTLFAHQREGIAWLAPRRRALLADQMGLGKTAQALLATPRGVPVAIVCPANVKPSWVREIQMWRPDLRPRILNGRHKWEWPLPGEAVIANYEVLPKIAKTLDEVHDEIPPKLETALIVDEAHYAKNSKAARTRSLREVAHEVLDNNGRVYLLTGTPLTNRPPELWNVLQVADLAIDAFGSFVQFKALMGASEGKFGLEWSGRVDTSVPARLRQVSLYRRREDVLDLPPKMRVAVPVPGEFPPNVQKLLDAVLAAMDAQGIDLDHATELVDLTRITGAAFEQLAAARAALATAKIPAMIEAVQEYEEAEEPVLVFSAHRAPIDLLGAREGWKIITGDTLSEHRQAIVDDFQAGRLKGLGLTIKAGGIGITLTRAAHEVFVDLAWTPADNNQAEDRAMRIGQTRPVLVKRLVADHEVDRRVEQILRAKQELIDAAIEPSAVVRVNQAAAPLVQHAAALEATLAKSFAIAPPAAPSSAQVAAQSFTPEPPAPTRRAPATPAEQWICAALLQLAGNDPDHASERNAVGFNQADNGFGHSLADQILETGGLTTKQYAAAKRLLAKYHGQVGRCPEGA